MKFFLKMLVVVCLLGAMYGQNGVSTYGISDDHETDSIDLYTLVPSFHFPVLSKAGAIRLSISMNLTQSCQIDNSGSFWICGASNKAPFTPQIGSALWSTTVSSFTTSGSVGGCYTVHITGLIDPQLGYHAVAEKDIASSAVCGTNTTTVLTTDGSHISATVTSTNAPSFPPIATNVTYPSGLHQNGTSYSVLDSFNNSLSLNGSYILTDTLGAQVTIPNTCGTCGFAPYSYTDTNGLTQQITFTTGSALSFMPYLTGACGIGSQSPNVFAPITSINYPDGTSYGLTWDGPNQIGNYSGFIHSVTLRTGGAISFAYAGGGYGGSCTTPRWMFNSIQRTTPDGITTYTKLAGGVTEIVDSGKNKIDYTFITVNPGCTGTYCLPVPVVTQIQKYQNTGSVASPTYVLTSTTSYCYNTVCNGGAFTYPVTQRDVYAYVGPTSKAMSHGTEVYDANGNTTSSTTYDYITGQTLVTTATFSGCGQGSTILDHPCDIKTINGSNTIAETKFTYNAAGAALAKQVWTGSQWLQTTITPNTNGTTASISDPNGQVTNIGYASGCNNLLPTASSTTINGAIIGTSQTWDCNGGVVLTSTDANGHTPPAIQYDSMFRPVLVTNNSGFSVGTSYTSNSVTVTPSLGTPSVTYLDSIGRPSISQKQQSNGSANYDTVSALYGWNGTNFETQGSSPCVAALGAPCGSYSAAFSNPAIGPVNSSNVLGGTTATTYNANDVSITAGPAPSGEHVKTVQTENDGFGRPKSVCALQTSGGTACGQVMGNSGVLTSFAYSFGSGTATTTATRGVQTHSTTTDALGRTLSGTTPERGTIANVYDSFPSPGVCGGWTSEPGDLMATTMASGDQICFVHDGLHRITTSSASGTNTCKRFRYDATTNAFFTPPSGYPTTGTNLVGRMVEAETDNCTAFPPTSATMLTDEWFAYDADGRMTDMWEVTPHSAGFYHATVSYNPDGTVASIGGIPGYATYTFGLDDQRRPVTAAQGSTVLVNGTTYDNASRPLSVLIGTNAADQDTFTYNGLEQMTNYSFTVGGKTMAGSPSWNAIGSLGSLGITDGFNAGGAMTCAFSYDDIARLGSSNCGTPGSWTYGYDQYDNLTKTGTTSWNPGYTASNNHMIGSSYDNDGNVTYDGVSTYAWDGYQKFAGVRPGATAVSCGTSGSSCPTYDAFGAIVETSNGGTYRELMYGPTGRLAQMNGQTAISAYIPLPGGLALFANGTSGSTRYIQHPDWLGTKRLSTSLGSRSQRFDTAYTPYGETFDTFGSLQADFTGDLSDVATGLFDTPNRELAQNSARWLSPDPVGANWNAYAYPTDPNTQADPSGLDPDPQDQTSKDRNGDVLPGADGCMHFPKTDICGLKPKVTLDNLLPGEPGGGGIEGTQSSSRIPTGFSDTKTFEGGFWGDSRVRVRNSDSQPPFDRTGTTWIIPLQNMFAHWFDMSDGCDERCQGEGYVQPDSVGNAPFFMFGPSSEMSVMAPKYGARSISVEGALKASPLTGYARNGSELLSFTNQWVRLRNGEGYKSVLSVPETTPTGQYLLWRRVVGGGKNAGEGGEVNPAIYAGFMNGQDPLWLQKLLGDMGRFPNPFRH